MADGGGGPNSQNWKRRIEKTRVGFARTDVSVQLEGIVVYALSSAHGPKGRGLEGVWKGFDFHDCL